MVSLVRARHTATMRSSICLVVVPLLLTRCSCDEPAPSVDEGEGESSEGEGDVVGEGEGDVVGEGEGEGVGEGEGEGEGDVGEGEGEGEGDVGEGEGEGGLVDGGVVDIALFVDDNCEVTATPSSISVAPGTGFYARFTNLPSSDIETNIDKIDRFNSVPLVIDLAPGEVFNDDIREWCGIERGTFSFRFNPCGAALFTFLDVDCDNTN